MANHSRIIVPCANCGVEVELSAEAAELATRFDAELARRGEKTLKVHELARCQPCVLLGREDAVAVSNRETADFMRAIDALKTGSLDPQLDADVRRGGFGAQFSRIAAALQRSRAA